MTTEEAVTACEFWTTDVAETKAIGSTRNPDVGLHFDVDEYQVERWSHPERVGWGFVVYRWLKDGTENPAYTMIADEIERRAG